MPLCFHLPAVAFQSTRPLRGATEGISGLFQAFSRHFNPRAPCGARPNHVSGLTLTMLFQSTRPLRGATGAGRCMVGNGGHFNPRAPCGARRRDGGGMTGHPHFNPRAPCGARLLAVVVPLHRVEFQSTRPLRGATNVPRKQVLHDKISIHAPLAGRDKARD